MHQLSDVEEGGATIFPAVNERILPEKVFYLHVFIITCSYKPALELIQNRTQTRTESVLIMT